MTGKNRVYARPTTIEDATRAMAAEGALAVSGGTDIYPAHVGKPLARPLVDLSRVEGLRGIWQTSDGIRLGAATTWTDILRATLPPVFDGLKAAAREVGSVQIQNRGTIAGNLCNASPAADGVPPLLAVDATVELAGPEGLRRLPLSAFLLGPRRTALRRGELLTAVIIPATASTGISRFVKLGARSSLVISIAMAAARIEISDGRVKSAALAIGACGPVSTRLPDLEQALIGAAATTCPALITPAAVAPALSPIDDIRATADYRRSAAAEILARAVRECIGEGVA